MNLLPLDGLAWWCGGDGWRIQMRYGMYAIADDGWLDGGGNRVGGNDPNYKQNYLRVPLRRNSTNYLAGTCFPPNVYLPAK